MVSRSTTLLSGTSVWWFAKLILSLLLLSWTIRYLFLHPPSQPLVGQALLLLGGTSNLLHYALLKRHAQTLGAPQKLRTTGGLFPWLRHPMYLSDIVLALGLAWLCQDPVGFGLFILYTGVIIRTAQQEDRMMQSHFGEAFAQWRSQTGLLLPRWPNSH